MRVEFPRGSFWNRLIVGLSWIDALRTSNPSDLAGGLEMLHMVLPRVRPAWEDGESSPELVAANRLHLATGPVKHFEWLGLSYTGIGVDVLRDFFCIYEDGDLDFGPTFNAVESTREIPEFSYQWLELAIWQERERLRSPEDPAAHLSLANDDPRSVVPDLSATQEIVFRALTDDYQTVSDLAAITNIDEGEVRRALANLKRFKLVDHKYRVGYKRLSVVEG